MKHVNPSSPVDTFLRTEKTLHKVDYRLRVYFKVRGKHDHDLVVSVRLPPLVQVDDILAMVPPYTPVSKPFTHSSPAYLAETPDL